MDVVGAVAGKCQAVCVGGCIGCRGAAVMGCVEIGWHAVRVGVVEFVNVVGWRATWDGSLVSRWVLLVDGVGVVAVSVGCLYMKA